MMVRWAIEILLIYRRLRHHGVLYAHMPSSWIQVVCSSINGSFVAYSLLRFNVGTAF
jgi:hypothetical protein